MLHAEEETTFCGIAELRHQTPKLLKEMQKHKVILTRRNQPVGVILNYEEYQRWNALIEQLEDAMLADVVKARVGRKNRKFISLEEAEKRVGLR